MSNWKLQDLRDERRRTFLKMCTVAAAAVGIERSTLLNFLADEGGHGLAEAAGSTYGRALIVPCPNGVYAWMQELWPMPDMATQSVNGNMGSSASSVASSYLYCNAYNYNGAGSLASSQGAPANYRGLYVGPKGAAKNQLGNNIMYTKVDPSTVSMLKYNPAGDRPMFYSPDAPWVDHVNGKPIYPVSCFMSGTDETHTQFPVSATKLSGTSVLQAALASLGAASSSAIVPVLGLDPVKYGRAPGAPEIATVPSAQGMIDLFNSAASQFTLKNQTDQQLFETYYKALIGLRKSSARSTWAPQLQITKNAARIIGLNFASQLTPADSDLKMFGVNDPTGSDALNSYGPGNSGMTFMSQSQKEKLDAWIRCLIVVARAFQLGLSKTAIISPSPGPTSDTTFTDPHVSFNSTSQLQAARNTTHFIGKALDAFYKLLGQTPDPESTGETLDKNTVFITYGDTPHDPLTGVTSSWADATPNGCNWLYVMDPKGNLKNGWFGQCYPNQGNLGSNMQSGKNAVGYSPITGLDDPSKTPDACSVFGSTAAVFACAHGDKNKTAEFGQSPNTIPALIKGA
jgi:hypothetical protein